MKVKELVRRGIPNHLRGIAWQVRYVFFFAFLWLIVDMFHAYYLRENFTPIRIWIKLINVSLAAQIRLVKKSVMYPILYLHRDAKDVQFIMLMISSGIEWCAGQSTRSRTISGISWDDQCVRESHTSGYRKVKNSEFHLPTMFYLSSSPTWVFTNLWLKLQLILSAKPIGLCCQKPKPW